MENHRKNEDCEFSLAHPATGFYEAPKQAVSTINLNNILFHNFSDIFRKLPEV